MNISRLALIALLGSALAAFGCSDDNPNGTGGNGGNGGTGGGGGALACVATTVTCGNGEIGDHVLCCEVAPPAQADACDGTENVVNPTSCTATGIVVTHLLTVMEVAADCNDGYDLDGCNGVSCDKGTLAPDEGIDGVDNALTGLAPVLVGVGGNLNGVNQAFSDALCGLTDDPEQATCDGGLDDGNVCLLVLECADGDSPPGTACAEDADCSDVQGTCSVTVATACTVSGDCPTDETCEGADIGTCVDVSDEGCSDILGTCSVTVATACTVNADCPTDETCEGEDIGTCNFDDDDCLMVIPPIEIRFVIDANAAENCANVKVISDGQESDVILNLGDPAEADAPVCASGTLGIIPVTIGGVPGAFGNTVIRTTVSADGFSDGLLGMTVDADTAVAIAEALLEGAGTVVGQVLDINTDLVGDVSAACNALSATFVIGGVSEAPAP